MPIFILCLHVFTDPLYIPEYTSYMWGVLQLAFACHSSNLQSATCYLTIIYLSSLICLSLLSVCLSSILSYITISLYIYISYSLSTYYLSIYLFIHLYLVSIIISTSHHLPIFYLLSLIYQLPVSIFIYSNHLSSISVTSIYLLNYFLLLFYFFYLTIISPYLSPLHAFIHILTRGIVMSGCDRYAVLLCNRAPKAMEMPDL